MKLRFDAKNVNLKTFVCTSAPEDSSSLVCREIRNEADRPLVQSKFKKLQIKNGAVIGNIENEDVPVQSRLVRFSQVEKLDHPALASSSTMQLKLANHASKNAQTATRGKNQDTISICSKDFGPNVNRTYIIKHSGKYRLETDVAFNGVDQLTPAILINPGVNNVELDLNGHTLAQGNNTTLIYGIWIGMTYFGSGIGNSNITIKNGSIVGFAGGGILSFANSYDEIYSDLHFFDLNILKNGIPGPDVDFFGAPGLSLNSDSSLFNGLIRPLLPTDAVYRNVIIERCRINETVGGSKGVLAVNVQFYDNLIIRDTQANNTFTPFQGGNGSFTFGYALYGTNLQMYDSEGNDTRSEDTNTRQVGAMDHEISQDSYFKDCQFNSAFGQAAFIVNTNISINVNITFENVQFNNNRGGVNAVQVYGAHGSGAPTLQFAGQAYKFINCEFNGASFDADPVGRELNIGGLILQNVSEIILDNCECRDISAVGTTFNATSVWGFFLPSAASDIPSNIAGDNDIVIRKCVVSNLRNVGGSGVIGIRTGGSNNNNAFGEQVNHHNTLIEDCIIQGISASINSDFYAQAPLAAVVTGIGDINTIFPVGFFAFQGFPGNQGSLSRRSNYIVRNCIVSDVHGFLDNDKTQVIAKSGGIIAESVQNVIITENEVTDCDVGILLAGFEGILPGPAGSNQTGLETCFQLATAFENATATPPVFIPLLGDFVEVVGHPEFGKFTLTPTIKSPPLAEEITAVGGVSDPITPCSGPAGNVNGKIGIVQFIPGTCGSVRLTKNAQAGGDVATIIINTDPPRTFTGISTQYNASVSLEDGMTLIEILNNDPTLQLRINSNALTVQGAIVTDQTTGNMITLTGSELVKNLSFLCTTEDLSALGWMPGDVITYTPGPNGPIFGLIPGQQYFLIVYRPGFVEHGLIKDNKVTTCLIAGFEDNAPTTNSIFLSNVSYCNGPDAASNYAINWAGTPPVTEGSPADYPRKSQFAKVNLSITC